MIVDAHCHLAPGLLPGASAEGTLLRTLRRAAGAGIERTVIFPGFAADYGAANEAVAATVAAHPGRLLGVACVHAERDGGRVLRLVHRAVTGHGFVGIKVHRRDASITAEICEAARAHGVPVLYDPMGEIERAVWFARTFADVRFVIPHLGSFADDARAQIALLAPLARLPNLFADTSGVKLFDLLVRAIRVAGPRKLLFGSDAPWLHPGVELAKIRALHLDPRDEARVLGRNAIALFGAAGMRAGLARAVRPPAGPRPDPARAWARA